MPEDSTINWVRWAGEQKLVMSVTTASKMYDVTVRSSRLLVQHLNGKGAYFLEVDGGVFDGDDLIHLAKDGSYALVSVPRDRGDYPSVYRYELEPGGERKRIIRPKPGVWNWYVDNDGVVRMGMGWAYKKLRVYYRADDDGDFELINRLKPDEDGKTRFWSVVQILSGSGKGYILAERDDGRVGIQLFDFVAGEKVEDFYFNPDWDVDRVWLNEDGSPLAAFYTDDRRQIVWFDEELGKRYRQLKQALGQDVVQIITRSDNNERMLIWAGSESDPGAFYVFTPSERKLDIFANARPALDFRSLAKPKPFKYTARDGLEIPGYLTLPPGRTAQNLPLIILPHGGPYGVRDELAYNDEVQLLANRGYAVLQPNYRGSGGYGDAFFEAGTGEIGRGMQDDLDDAMDWAVEQGIADPERVCVVGASYGGYAALWAVLRNPERYRCAASWAGVTDWDNIIRYDSRYLSRSGGRRWQERIAGDRDFDLKSVSPVFRARDLSRPVLLAHGSADKNVPVWQYEDFERASRKAPVPPTTLLIEDEGHGFSNPENLKRWFDALEAFLQEHNPPDASEKVAVS
ncbi:MAG: alpha/beta fold hydrolase [Pseudomonadota bacterium]